MSQKIEDKTDAAEARTQQTRGFMQQVRNSIKAEVYPGGEGPHRAGRVPTRGDSQ